MGQMGAERWQQVRSGVILGNCGGPRMPGKCLSLPELALFILGQHRSGCDIGAHSYCPALPVSRLTAGVPLIHTAFTLIAGLAVPFCPSVGFQVVSLALEGPSRGQHLTGCT